MNDITTNQVTTTSNQPATMSSLELVAIINEVRALNGKPKLTHANLIKKIERHPGMTPSKFLRGYLDEQGQERKCYNLPRRECDLLTMSESLALQAQVYDRLVKELEGKSAQQIGIAHVDLTRGVYFGKPHDATVAGLYYAAVEANVMGVEYAAEKYGLSIPFVQSLLRFKPEHLRAWDPRTRDGSSFPPEAPTAIGTKRTDPQIEANR